MTAARRCKVLGKWRLTEADQWDRSYLDLVEPAYIRFDENGRGEMVFGALQAGLECEIIEPVRCRRAVANPTSTPPIIGTVSVGASLATSSGGR